MFSKDLNTLLLRQILHLIRIGYSNGDYHLECTRRLSGNNLMLFFSFCWFLISTMGEQHGKVITKHS